jgi:hypothetical protein
MKAIFVFSRLESVNQRLEATLEKVELSSV